MGRRHRSEYEGTTEQSPRGGRLVMPAVHDMGSVLYLCLWIPIWAGGNVLALVASHTSQPSTLFLAVWNLFGVYAALTLTWWLAGKEVATVRHGRLLLRREILGFGCSREFTLAEIRDVRTRRSEAWWGGTAVNLPLFGFRHGTVVFDYRGSTYGFGLGLKEEASKSMAYQLSSMLRSAGARL